MAWGLVAGAAIGAVGMISAADSAGQAADAATAAQSSAAAGQLKLGQDQLDWNKQIYGDTKAQRDAATATSQKAAESQLAGMDFANEQAKDYQAYNKSTFRPLEQGLVSDAQSYDTQQRRTDAAAGAQADVDQSFQATRDANDRDLARSGIAPGSGKAMSLMQDATVAQAAARAGAGTMAARNVEQQGYARRMDAAALGRNLPSSQATQQSLGTSAGSAASASGLQGVTASTSGIAGVNSGFSGAISAGGSAGSLYGSAAALNNQSAAATSAGFGQLGQAIGSLSNNKSARNYMSNLFSGSSGYPANVEFDSSNSFDSSKALKKNTDKPLDGKKALKGIVKTPVRRGWMYDRTKAGAPDDGERPHDGPMAQDVAKHMGTEVAPGGKKIDVPSMNGHMMAAIQELAKQVKTLKKASA